jgi:hypothetical protein
MLTTRLLPSLRVVFAAGVVGTAAWAASPSSGAELAGPRIIMFHAGVLGEERIHLTDVYENMRFMQAIASPVDTVPPDYKAGPFVEVAMFWHNPTWEPYAKDSALLRTLRPEQGQRSTLYLARPGFHTFVDFPVYIKHRLVDSIGMEILKRHRIPTMAGQPGGSVSPAPHQRRNSLGHDAGTNTMWSVGGGVGVAP